MLALNYTRRSKQDMNKIVLIQKMIKAKSNMHYENSKENLQNQGRQIYRNFSEEEKDEKENKE